MADQAEPTDPDGSSDGQEQRVNLQTEQNDAGLAHKDRNQSREKSSMPNRKQQKRNQRGRSDGVPQASTTGQPWIEMNGENRERERAFGNARRDGEEEETRLS